MHESGDMGRERLAPSVDRDFEEAEQEQDSFAVHYFTRYLMDGIFGYGKFGVDARRSGELRREVAGTDPAIRHFLLPGIPGGTTGSIAEIREAEPRHYHSEFQRTRERSFFEVAQGEMWSVERAKHPYFDLTMTECSAVVGRSADRLFVAHISFSELSELEAAVRFMRDGGVPASELYAIASLPPTEYDAKKKAGIDEFGPRAWSVEDYHRIGVKQVRPFFYRAHPRDAKGHVLLENMARVLVTDRFLFLSHFDSVKDMNSRYSTIPRAVPVRGADGEVHYTQHWGLALPKETAKEES